MPRFHTLTVNDLHKTTREAIVLTLKPESGDFSFIQGQYLTFRRDFDGVELRRSYSICAGIDDGTLQVGIKRVDGGAFSTWANESLKIGDTLNAMEPMGNFHTPLTPDAKRHYLGFAGGSGITPILSILRTVLSREPNARFTLIYANRGVSSIMFRDELEDLKNTYMDRLNIIHILEQDAQDIDLFTGRIDAEKCAGLFKHWINLSDISTAFICGPEPMMLTISAALKDHGLKDDQIKVELFLSAQPGRAIRSPSVTRVAAAGIAATAILDGESRNFQIDAGVTLLEAARENELDAPFACRAGVCSTCKAKLIEGEVEMMANHALEDYEVERGYVLTCQSIPLSEKVVFDYDQ